MTKILIDSGKLGFRVPNVKIEFSDVIVEINYFPLVKKASIHVLSKDRPDLILYHSKEFEI